MVCLCRHLDMAVTLAMAILAASMTIPIELLRLSIEPLWLLFPLPWPATRSLLGAVLLSVSIPLAYKALARELSKQGLSCLLPVGYLFTIEHTHTQFKLIIGQSRSGPDDSLQRPVCCRQRTHGCRLHSRFCHRHLQRRQLHDYTFKLSE